MDLWLVEEPMMHFNSENKKTFRCPIGERRSWLVESPWWRSGGEWNQIPVVGALWFTEWSKSWNGRHAAGCFQWSCCKLKNSAMLILVSFTRKWSECQISNPKEVQRNESLTYSEVASWANERNRAVFTAYNFLFDLVQCTGNQLKFHILHHLICSSQPVQFRWFAHKQGLWRRVEDRIWVEGTRERGQNGSVVVKLTISSNWFVQNWGCQLTSPYLYLWAGSWYLHQSSWLNPAKITNCRNGPSSNGCRGGMLWNHLKRLFLAVQPTHLKFCWKIKKMTNFRKDEGNWAKKGKIEN